MAKLVVLSDIHGNLPALEAAFEDLRTRPYDALFCLGDLAAFGPWPDECIAYVRDVVKPTAIIAGNTDRYLLEEPWKKEKKPGELLKALAACRKKLSKESLAYLESLPAHHSETIDDVEIELVHGGPGDDEMALGPMAEPDAMAKAFADHGPGVTFAGHTHVPWRGRAGERTIVNDGSIGFPFDGDQRACYVRAKVAHGRLQDFEFRRVHYRVDRVIEEMLATAGPFHETLVRRLRFAKQ